MLKQLLIKWGVITGAGPQTSKIRCNKKNGKKLVTKATQTTLPSPRPSSRCLHQHHTHQVIRQNVYHGSLDNKTIEKQEEQDIKLSRGTSSISSPNKTHVGVSLASPEVSSCPSSSEEVDEFSSGEYSILYIDDREDERPEKERESLYRRHRRHPQQQLDNHHHHQQQTTTVCSSPSCFSSVSSTSLGRGRTTRGETRHSMQVCHQLRQEEEEEDDHSYLHHGHHNHCQHRLRGSMRVTNHHRYPDKIRDSIRSTRSLPRCSSSFRGIRSPSVHPCCCQHHVSSYNPFCCQQQKYSCFHRDFSAENHDHIFLRTKPAVIYPSSLTPGPAISFLTPCSGGDSCSLNHSQEQTTQYFIEGPDGTVVPVISSPQLHSRQQEGILCFGPCTGNHDAKTAVLSPPPASPSLSRTSTLRAPSFRYLSNGTENRQMLSSQTTIQSEDTAERASIYSKRSQVISPSSLSSRPPSSSLSYRGSSFSSIRPTAVSAQLPFTTFSQTKPHS